MFLAILKGFSVELFFLSDQQVKRKVSQLTENVLLNMHDAFTDLIPLYFNWICSWNKYNK